MGRPSNLTAGQWAKVEQRLKDGDKSLRAVALEFGVSPASVSKRFAPEKKHLKDVAAKVCAAEEALDTLPLLKQRQVFEMVADLRGIASNLTAAAHLGSQTAHKLARIAAGQVDRVVEAAKEGKDPMESAEILQGASALGKLANEAGRMGLKLLTANRERLAADEANTPVPEDEEDLSGLSVAELRTFRTLANKTRAPRVIEG